MKKFLKYSFIFLVIASFLVGPAFVFAQDAPPDSGATSGTGSGATTFDPATGAGEFGTGAGTGIQSSQIPSGGIGAPGNVPSNPDAYNTPGADGTTLKTIGDCEGWFKFFSSLINCGFANIANVFLTIVSRILWVAGILFNVSMNFTLNLSDYAGKLNIDEAWKAIRDLINITFIFGLLWIAIATILDLAGDYKKHLASIIIAALLINFSLFFTKVIIDVSNTVALQFYSAITAGQFNKPNAPWDGGITDMFMERLQLQTVYKIGGSATEGVTAGSGGSLSLTSIFMVAILGSIFILIAAAVFFVAALMLIARSAMLILLMVTSPIGFVGAWIPKLKTYADMWWKELINQSLFAPIFLLLIFVILKMTEPKTASVGGSLIGDGSDTGRVSFAAALAGSDGSSVTIILSFCLIIAFLIAALNAAKGLSGMAGKNFSAWGGESARHGGRRGRRIFRQTINRQGGGVACAKRIYEK